ncbi:MAG: hypothetical protein M1819_006754 [Sarea resinae]|nr:MAG: hypothetical protein M1819_006754 [Sarea resinae]
MRSWASGRHHSSSPHPNIAALLASAKPGATANNTVTVNAFVRSVRKQKRVAFVALGDGSTFEPLQAVLDPSLAQGSHRGSLSSGVAVKIEGSFQPSPPGKQQSHELHARGVRIVGEADATTYPLQKKYHTPEYLRTIPHLRSRTAFNSLLLRLRSHSIANLTNFFAERAFVQTHPPIITSSDCEGAGEVFSISADASQNPALRNEECTEPESFFRAPKYLTVSSQLHLEALAQSVGNVWTLSPTFRAEKSDTARHLSEFYMLEAELSFIEDMSQLTGLVEDMLRNLALSLQNSNIGKELLAAKADNVHKEEGETVTGEDLQRRWQGLVDGPWPRITYAHALKHLEDAVKEERVAFKFPPSWDSGLQTEHERFLAADVGQGSPVFVTNYPQIIKPFYMLPSSPRPMTGDGVTAAEQTVACFDLLMPDICEVVGGSMREHRLQQLMESMRTHGLIKPRVVSDSNGPAQSLTPTTGEAADETASEELGDLKWYIDLRRWGSVPHGGFGLGFDRLLGYLAGVSNIREVVTFPRWVGRCDC